jgi:hypothetical protein
LEFKHSYWGYGYYLQASFYLAGMWAIMAQDEKLKDYKLLPFKFMVVHKNDKYQPAIMFELSNENMDIGAFGGLHEGKFYSGFIELLETFLWHKQNDIWTIPKQIIDNNYLLKL